MRKKRKRQLTPVIGTEHLVREKMGVKVRRQSKEHQVDESLGGGRRRRKGSHHWGGSVEQRRSEEKMHSAKGGVLQK